MSRPPGRSDPKCRRACLAIGRAEHITATKALTSIGGLAPYAAKRSFKDTPEPAPAERKDAWGPLLCYPAARGEVGTSTSAFELGRGAQVLGHPKGPRNKTQCHNPFAVMTEDHPFDYGSFEGAIPPASSTARGRKRRGLRPVFA